MPVPVLMPSLSPTMEEGTLARWYVGEGDPVTSGDLIAEIETDKATMEVEAIHDGRIGKILVAQGSENVPVNATIAILLEEGEDNSALSDFEITAVESGKKPDQAERKEQAQKTDQMKKTGRPHNPATPSPVQKPSTARREGENRRLFASPLARRLAGKAGLDLAGVSGSGPRGRIVRQDVETALAGHPAGKPTPGILADKAVDPRIFYTQGSYEDIPLNNMRKTIARRLTQSKQEIPHYYLGIDCELDEVLRARKLLNARPDTGVRISVNDFVVRACALALEAVPDVNVSYAGESLLRHKNADIGIAVAIEGGLVTPIIRAAEQKGLAQISREARDLAARARERKLKPDEFEGGSFSVSNLGMFGIRDFTAVINPPQSAILAVGTAEQRPVVKEGHLEVATMMSATLSCDHRVIDGALGARFLQAFRNFLETPLTMLM